MKLKNLLFLLGINFVQADGYDLSDKFITNSSGTLADTMMEFASNAYWLFLFISILYIGYKVITALNIYFDRSVHPVQQVQALHEILEAPKGLIYLQFGILFIRLAIGIFYPNISKAIRTSTMATFIGNLLGATNQDELAKNLISAACNLLFYIFTLTYAFKTVFAFVQSFKAENESDRVQLQSQAKKNLAGVIVGLLAGSLINLMLRVLGLGGLFTIK